MCFRDKHVCEMEGKLWGSGETWYERSQLQMSQLQSVTSACSGGSVLGLCFYLDQFWIVPKMGNRANMELANRNRGHQRWYPGLRRNCCWRSGFAQSHLHILQGCDLSPTGAPKLSIGRYRKAAAMRTSMRSREGRRDQLRVWHQLPPTSLAKWQNMCAKRKENFEEGEKHDMNGLNYKYHSSLPGPWDQLISKLLTDIDGVWTIYTTDVSNWCILGNSDRTRISAITQLEVSKCDCEVVSSP